MIELFGQKHSLIFYILSCFGFIIFICFFNLCFFVSKFLREFAITPHLLEAQKRSLQELKSNLKSCFYPIFIFIIISIFVYIILYFLKI